MLMVKHVRMLMNVLLITHISVSQWICAQIQSVHTTVAVLMDLD